MAAAIVARRESTSACGAANALGTERHLQEPRASTASLSDSRAHAWVRARWPTTAPVVGRWQVGGETREERKRDSRNTLPPHHPHAQQLRRCFVCLLLVSVQRNEKVMGFLSMCSTRRNRLLAARPPYVRHTHRGAWPAALASGERKKEWPASRPTRWPTLPPSACCPVSGRADTCLGTPSHPPRARGQLEKLEGHRRCPDGQQPQ